jgi:hypothetical protein
VDGTSVETREGAPPATLTLTIYFKALSPGYAVRQFGKQITEDTALI